MCPQAKSFFYQSRHLCGEQLDYLTNKVLSLKTNKLVVFFPECLCLHSGKEDIPFNLNWNVHLVQGASGFLFFFGAFLCLVRERGAPIYLPGIFLVFLCLWFLLLVIIYETRTAQDRNRRNMLNISRITIQAGRRDRAIWHF